MAEVIAIGASLEWKQGVKCSSCRTEFVADVNDIIIVGYEYRMYKAGVLCPQCGVRNLVYDVPVHIIKQFKQKSFEKTKKKKWLGIF